MSDNERLEKFKNVRNDIHESHIPSASNGAEVRKILLATFLTLFNFV